MEKKKLRSHQKDYYFRKTSPNHKKQQYIFEGKSQKRVLEIHTQSSKQSIQHENRSKQFSFLRFIPFTTKNQSQKNLDQNHMNIKELKIPSFFKKQNKTKDQNQTIFYDKNNQEKRESKKQINYNAQRQSSLHQSTKSNQQTSNSSLSTIQITEYKKLNDKINYLLNKISGMKQTLDKKRVEKLCFMQCQKSQRASTFYTEENYSTCSSTQSSLKKFVTQVPQHKDLYAFSQNPYSPRHSLYYVSQILRAYKQQKSLARQHILSSVQYLKMFQYSKIPQELKIEHLKVNLPKLKGHQDRKTIIFDLDETLIHCNQNVYMSSDIKIKINFPTGQLIQVGINIRPYAKQILAVLSKKFQIIVFTASHSCYANVVLDHLDPQKKHIHHRLFRESCYCTPQGVYVKDLRILNRNLSKVILVDNAAYSYAYQPLNGVPIIPYYEGKNDYELPALQKYIQSLIFSFDVRQKNKNMFKLDRYAQFNDLNTLVQTLYSKGH